MGLGHEYYLRRWMMFVDGENLTFRAQDFWAARNRSQPESHLYRKDTFVWLPGKTPTDNPGFANMEYELQPRAIRAYYYTSVQGDDQKLREVREALWKLGFQPEVFKKMSGERRSKGVDISLAKDVLSNAFLNNFEAAVLVAGDGDYVPLVAEAKRLGKRIYVLFLSEKGLSDDLRLSSDVFIPLDTEFENFR